MYRITLPCPVCRKPVELIFESELTKQEAKKEGSSKGMCYECYQKMWGMV